MNIVTFGNEFQNVCIYSVNSTKEMLSMLLEIHIILYVHNMLLYWHELYPSHCLYLRSFHLVTQHTRSPPTAYIYVAPT